MTESEYIQQHETYLSSIVSRFIARYPEQRRKMWDDLMQEARIALLIAYRKQENTAGLERRAYICIIDALYTAAVHAYPIRIPRRKFRKNVGRFSCCGSDALALWEKNQPEDESAQEMELWAILAGMNDKEQAFVRCRLDGRNCIEAAKMLGMLSDAAANQALPDVADAGGIMKDVRRRELFCRLFCLLCRTIHGITNSPKHPDFCIHKSLLNNLRIFAK